MVPAGPERSCYHPDKEQRSEAAHPPLDLLLLRPRPAQRGQGRARRRVHGHVVNSTVPRTDRHHTEDGWLGLTPGGLACIHGQSVVGWLSSNSAPMTFPVRAVHAGTTTGQRKGQVMFLLHGPMNVGQGEPPAATAALGPPADAVGNWNTT